MRVQGGKYFLNEMNEQTNHEVCFLLDEICSFFPFFHILCSEAYLEPIKHSILDVWQGSE